MRSGRFLPLFDQLADPAIVAPLSAEAEEAGWHGVFVWDHVAVAGDGRRRGRRVDHAGGDRNLCSVGVVLTARSRLPSPAGTGEDAPVEVLKTHTRRQRRASRHRPAPEAITAVLVEFRRS